MNKKKRAKLEEKALRHSFDLLRRYGNKPLDLTTVAYLMQLAYIQGFLRR